MARPESREAPAVGDVMVDEARERIGEFRGAVGGKFWLRPIGGGREWEASPDVCRGATDEEKLRERVSAANERSRNGVVR